MLKIELKANDFTGTQKRTQYTIFLLGIIEAIENGDTEGVCKDFNGNNAGYWKLDIE